MKTFRLSTAVIIVLLMALLSLTTANAKDFETIVKVSAEDTSVSAACDRAYIQAEQEAKDQIDDFFSENEDAHFSIRLLNEKETRSIRENGKSVCVFEGTWQAQEIEQISELIDSEQAIEGEYQASCDHLDVDECWEQIVKQAKRELRNQLNEEYTNVAAIELNYIDFEGRERERSGSSRSDVTATGTFYFRVAKYDPENAGNIHIYRKDRAPAVSANEPPADENIDEENEHDNNDADDDFDFTLFYTWDRNDRVDHNDLGISSDRWGLGVWTQNRIGFAAFFGQDTMGIGDRDDDVKNASGTYKTMGIGLGYRIFDSRAVTIENMLYYVDAQPYSALVNPDCDSCDAQPFTSENYVQATTNLKTNTTGLNIGWMFTWKWLEREANLNRWSSGFYLELQL
ncbi:MAG: hypothetical protein P8X74_04785 [Reinekea sp.]